VETDRAAVAEFLESEKGASRPPPIGVTKSCSLVRGDNRAFLETLRAAHDNSAVPGRFFGSRTIPNRMGSIRNVAEACAAWHHSPVPSPKTVLNQLTQIGFVRA